jgi:hypothetical protein
MPAPPGASPSTYTSMPSATSKARGFSTKMSHPRPNLAWIGLKPDPEALLGIRILVPFLTEQELWSHSFDRFWLLV